MKARLRPHAIAGGKVRIGERIAQQRIGEESWAMVTRE
jgi:hypothetical protein